MAISRYPTHRWTLPSYVGEVCEMLGTRTEENGATEFQGKVQLKVPYVDRFALIYHIYMNDCCWPWHPACYFRSASVTPFTGAAEKEPDIPDDIGGPEDGLITETIRYMYALVNLNYSTCEAVFDPNNEPAVRMYIETFEPNVEFQIMSPELFHWGSVPTPPNGRAVTLKEAPARQIRTAVYTVKWLQQFRVPIEFWELLGCVHDQEYTIEQYGSIASAGPPPVPAKPLIAKPETLLFMPGPVEKSIWYRPDVPDLGDDDYDPLIHDVQKLPYPGYDYTCRFAYRPSTWNKYYRGDHLEADPPPDPVDPWEFYERMYQKQPNNTSRPFDNYPVKDLSKLLPIPTPPPGP